MYRFGFIVEQALGQITHGKNLKQNLAHESDIEAVWGLPSWEAEGIAARVDNWTVKAGLQARNAVRDMQREKPVDALLFHTQVTAVLAQDWMRKIPSIVSLDATPLQYDSLGEFYDHTPGTGSAEKVKYWLNQRCYQTARHIVTWSDWAKEGLIKEYDVCPEKITTIAPGVTLSDWQRPEERTLQSDDKACVRILFVGGNLDRKGGHLLLQAVRHLHRESYPVELHLVTKDSVEAEPGLIVYNDMQPNSDRLKQLYHDCDIFCLPTRGDCLPMVLAEAGATGMPIVSTDVAAIPEIVQDGETGFLVPPDDVDALITALRRLIVNPELRLRMGSNAAKLIATEHDAVRNSQKILQLLKEVAAGKQKS